MDEGPDREARAALRRFQADFRDMDQRRFDVILADIRIEREVDRLIRRWIYQPDDVAELGYNKRLSHMKTFAPDVFGVKVVEAAIAFHKLRNSAAHGHDNKTFDARAATVKGLVGHFSKTQLPKSAHFGTIGMGIVAALHVSFGD